jgi:hypothetical protein
LGDKIMELAIETTTLKLVPAHRLIVEKGLGEQVARLMFKTGGVDVVLEEGATIALKAWRPADPETLVVNMTAWDRPVDPETAYECVFDDLALPGETLLARLEWDEGEGPVESDVFHFIVIPAGATGAQLVAILAGMVGVVPVGTISSSTVQGAIAELSAEKVDKDQMGTFGAELVGAATLAAAREALGLDGVPQLLTAPTISGNAVGAPITSTPGTWTGEPDTFEYQWQISDDGLTGWADIEGETADSYTPGSGDEGKYARVKVIAGNATGSSAPAYSAASDALEASDFPPGAVAFWKLDNATDATGNGHTLTNNNGVAFTAGKVGNCAAFDATNWLSGNLGTRAEISISLWARITDLEAGENQIYLSSESDSYPDLRLGGWTGGSNFLYWGGTGVSIANICDGDWHHIVVTYDGQYAKAYFDGVLTQTIDNGPEAGAADLSTWILGIDADLISTGLTGNVDAIGLWDRVLTLGEIAALYNGGAGIEPA